MAKGLSGFRWEYKETPAAFGLRRRGPRHQAGSGFPLRLGPCRETRGEFLNATPARKPAAIGTLRAEQGLGYGREEIFGFFIWRSLCHLPADSCSWTSAGSGVADGYSAARESLDLGNANVTKSGDTRKGEGSASPQADYAGLMLATQGGDPEAYRRLLEAVQPMLFGYLRKRLRSPEAAEDVSQEVLLTMHRVRHTFEPGRPFEPWFFSIARSRLIDHLRKVKRVSANEYSTDVLPEVSEDQALPDWARFMEVLEILPEAQREAFSLLKIEGLSTVEAAEKVGISVSALKVRAHRAYNTLKKGLLEEEGE